jgi:hypothetical protein
VVIPLGVALAVLLFLHRRHVQKLRKEDADDKHKSLDFGLDGAPTKPSKNARKAPQMSMAEKEGGGRVRGLSMDMGLPNPYLLPPEVQHSRESLHSLSRSLNTGDDKYRATTFIPDDGSIRPPSSLRSPIDDSSSSFTGSSRGFQQDSKRNLLQNAQDNPRGGRNSSADMQGGERNHLTQLSSNHLLAPTSADQARDSFVSTTSSTGAANALRASNNYLAQFISSGNQRPQEDLSKKEPVAVVAEIRIDPPVEEVQPPPPVLLKDAPFSAAPTSHVADHSATPSITVSHSEERQPRLPQLSFIDSQGVKQNSLEGETRPPTMSAPANHTPHQSDAPSTQFSQHQEASQPQPASPNTEDQYIDDYYDEDDDQGSQYPQEYEDYQEYQEYLGHDPRRSTMGVRPLPLDDPSENPEQRANRIRSFYKEYFDDSKPPNATPTGQYYDGTEGYYGQGGYYEPPSAPFSARSGRHRATVSNGSYMSGPRAYSSASARLGAPPAHAQMKKKLPPPKPLNVLPTPHLLKDDLTFIPIDFAPPKKFQNQRAGTPDSLRGGIRPYTPTQRAHIPLASSFDDLAVIPSPHALRKSTTFTALDFAPPPRLRGGETMSETGSIRSNRSGMSAMHLHNIRTGAYRISRIPKEVAGTKDEMVAALKPQWNLTR